MGELIRINTPDVMIPSSFRRPTHREQVYQAAKAITEAGRRSYPPATRQETIISNDFVLLEGTSTPQRIGQNLWQVEREFLEGIRDAQLVYGVIANGYAGKSSSVEEAYGLALGKNVVLSEPIRQFGGDVPQTIRDILLTRQNMLPLLPIEDITANILEDILARPPTYDPLTDSENEQFFMLSLLSSVTFDQKNSRHPTLIWKLNPTGQKKTLHLSLTRLCIQFLAIRRNLMTKNGKI